MSKTVTVSGASDDLVEWEGCDGADEFNIISSEVWVGTFLLDSPTEGRMHVHAVYDGTWSFAVARPDEDVLLPDWPVIVRDSPHNGYSTEVAIECPDDVFLTLAAKGKS